MKLWGGRFNKKTNNLVEKYNASITFDYKLALYDIQGSIAHAAMLKKQGLISHKEMQLIHNGLIRIKNKILNDDISFTIQDEDIHMNIERILHQEIGEIAGKLHTGRSRNDQVALDLHLYVRKQIITIVKYLFNLLSTIHQIAQANINTIIPGYTHLQRAEPVRFAHHLLAYFNMFKRDLERFQDCFPRANCSPLGAGALAGSGVDIDRTYVAEELAFDSIYTNSIDAVSDRDFIVEFLSNASLLMMHFSRLSEEIILWNSEEFAFVQLDDAFATGSSMMPQKKNPDICELARGKTGRVYGSLIGLLTTLKGLPLAYNKDLQEDKEGLFDTVQTLIGTIAVYIPMLATMKINKQNMQKATENDFSNATNLANYLVNKNIPFRRAHEITGNIVSYCINNNLLLKNLNIDSYKNFCNQIEMDVYEILDIEAVIEAHNVIGGTSKDSVKHQLKTCEKILGEIEFWIEKHNEF